MADERRSFFNVSPSVEAALDPDTLCARLSYINVGVNYGKRRRDVLLGTPVVTTLRTVGFSLDSDDCGIRDTSTSPRVHVDGMPGHADAESVDSNVLENVQIPSGECVPRHYQLKRDTLECIAR